MKAVSATQKGTTVDGRRIMDVFVLSDNDPDTLPTNGADVDGLLDDDIFAPFSILFSIAGPKVYIANESGEFTEPS